MGRRPGASEMVIPRKDHPLVPRGTRWKVTARYWLRLTMSKTVYCIRVTSGANASGNPVVLHMHEDVFGKLFRAETEDEYLRWQAELANRPRKGR